MVNSSCHNVFEIRIDKEGNKSTMKNRNGMEKWSVLVVSPLTDVKVQTFREGFLRLTQLNSNVFIEHM